MGVPLDLWIGFENASSRGRFFNFRIRERFSHFL